MTCTVGPVSAIVIDVIHPGVRATGASVLALFQNLFGLAAGPFIAGVLSDAWGLTPRWPRCRCSRLLAALRLHARRAHLRSATCSAPATASPTRIERAPAPA